MRTEAGHANLRVAPPACAGRLPLTDPAPTVSPDFPGYELLGELGRGGMGVVHRARDLARGEVVALKTLQHGDPAALYRFKHEFRAFADLAHRNLVSLYELRSDGRVWFFTMELLRGRDALAHVRAEPAALREVFAQLATGLAALHAAGFVHRDVKPSNVLVEPGGRVVLLDFGLAAGLSEDGLHRSTRSHVLGTVAYMSPEQASGRPVSAASDLYSLGVLLFEAVTGRLPFDGDALQVLLDKRSRDAPRAASVAADVPPELDLLCAELLERDPTRRPTADAVRVRLAGEDAASRPGASPQRAPALVGRGRELAALDGAFDATARGAPAVALVHGASGMGKTALVQAFVDDLAARRGAIVLAGRCYERESVPFKAFDAPIDELARRLARMPRLEAEALLPRDVGSLTRVFPALLRAESVAQAPQTGADVADPEVLRRRAHVAVRELLARIADRRPLVLWFDDAQWGDADSADLLASALRPPDAPAVLAILSYRRDDAAARPFVEPVVRATADLALHVQVPVDALPADDAALLAARLVGGDADRARAIAGESRGNPFLLVEMAEFGGSADGALSVDDMLRARAARLAPEARRILEVVAVAGGAVPAATALQAAAVVPPARAATAALFTGRLVRSKGGGGTPCLDTYHDRVRESVLAALAPDALREHHRRIALALEMAGGADPERLAVHFEGAGETARAGEHYERAADAAAGALAFVHAARLYALAARHAGDRGRHLRIQRAHAFRNARRGAEAAGEYLAAAADPSTGDSFELRLRAAEQFLVSGRADEGLQLAREVLASVGIEYPGSTRRAITLTLACFARIVLAGSRFRPRSASEVPVILLRRFDACHAFSYGIGSLDVTVAAWLSTRALVLGLRAGEPRRIAAAIAMVRMYSRFAGPVRGLLEARIRSAVRRTRSVHDPRVRGLEGVAEMWSAVQEGRWRDCVLHGSNGERVLRDECVGVTLERNVAVLYPAMGLDFLGDFSALRERTAHALLDAEDRGDRFLACALRARATPVAALVEGDAPRALGEIARSRADWARPGYDVIEWWRTETSVPCLLFEGDTDGAAATLARAWSPLAESQLLRGPLVSAIAHALRARTALAVAARCAPGRARERSVRDALRDAARVARCRVTCAAAWAGILRAGAASIRGDADAALRLSAAAESAFAATDMPAWAAVARRRRGEILGGDEGRALVRAADEDLRARGVRDPVRWAAAHAPGFPS